MYVVVQLYLSVRAYSPLSQCQLHQMYAYYCVSIVLHHRQCISIVFCGTKRLLRTTTGAKVAYKEPVAIDASFSNTARIVQNYMLNGKEHSAVSLIHRKHLSAPYTFRREHRTDSFAFRCVDDNKFRKIICTKLFLEICGNLL